MWQEQRRNKKHKRKLESRATRRTHQLTNSNIAFPSSSTPYKETYLNKKPANLFCDCAKQADETHFDGKDNNDNKPVRTHGNPLLRDDAWGRHRPFTHIGPETNETNTATTRTRWKTTIQSKPTETSKVLPHPSRPMRLAHPPTLPPFCSLHAHKQANLLPDSTTITKECLFKKENATGLQRLQKSQRQRGVPSIYSPPRTTLLQQFLTNDYNYTQVRPLPELHAATDQTHTTFKN